VSSRTERCRQLGGDVGHDLEDVLHVLARQRRYRIAAARLQNEESLAAQGDQRLADRRGAGAELLGDVLKAEEPARPSLRSGPSRPGTRPWPSWARFYGGIYGWTTATVDDHHAILEALRAHDADAARAAMHAHITHAGELLVEHLSNKGFWDQAG
jgi:FCD domain